MCCTLYGNFVFIRLTALFRRMKSLEDLLSGFSILLIQFFDKTTALTHYKPRDPFANKGNFGTALILAGSYGKIGAAMLAAKACLCAGAGLLTSHLPSCGYEIMQTAVPEAMVQIDDGRISTDRLSCKTGYISGSRNRTGYRNQW